ncbi:Ubiquitin-like protease family profile domain-containing protein [Plasmodiophora brassicae]
MPGRYPTCFALDSQLYAKMMQGGQYAYENVRTWARWFAHEPVFDYDFIFVPICDAYHWFLMVVQPKLKLVEWYDSLQHTPPRTEFGRNIIRYVRDLYLDMTGRPWETEWTCRRAAGRFPKQSNGTDCVVFVIVYADYLANSSPMTFSGTDISFYRRRWTVEIARKDMLDCPREERNLNHGPAECDRRSIESPAFDDVPPIQFDDCAPNSNSAVNSHTTGGSGTTLTAVGDAVNDEHDRDGWYRDRQITR